MSTLLKSPDAARKNAAKKKPTGIFVFGIISGIIKLPKLGGESNLIQMYGRFVGVPLELVHCLGL